MEKSPKHFIIFGRNCAGKTTFVQEFAPLIGGVPLGGDLLLRQWGVTEKTLRREHIQALDFELERRTKNVLQYGRHVVTESVYLKPEQRRKVVDFTKALGFKPVLIYVDADTPTVVQRWNNMDDAKRVSALILVNNSMSFEPPTPEEEHVVFQSGVDSVPEWMLRNASLLD